MKTTYADYLKSARWASVSEKVKKRDGYQCRLCGRSGLLCVHHRTYRHLGNEMMHTGDLTTLCHEHHKMFHGVIPTPSPNETVFICFDEQVQMPLAA